MKRAVQFALRSYKRWISPMLPHACRFVPTCSEYAHEAVERHGVLRGSMLALGRLLRCHPFSRAGYDPVPPTPQWCARSHQNIGSVMPKPITRRY